MTPGELISLLGQVEATYPVDRWTVAGVHVWPLVRCAFACTSEVVGVTRLAPKKPSRFQKLERLAQFARATVADRRNNDALSQADAVFLGHAVDRTRVLGAWSDPFSEPFVLGFRKLGKRCLVLERAYGGDYRTPRALPSHYVSPSLALAQWLRERAQPPAASVALEGFEDFRRLVASRAPEAHVMSRADLVESVQRFRALVRYFHRVLRRTRPRFGFVICYYDATSMAFVQACRELGVTSIDVQHGVEGDLHPAYAAWRRVPPAGFESLPRIFWVWSEAEARTIETWNGEVSRHHAPFVGGNLWLEEWRSGESPSVAATERAIQAVVRTTPGAKNVLVTLQPLADPIPELVRAAIRRTKGRWRWWVRLHPTMHWARAEIRASLARDGLEHVVIDEATDLPLCALLRCMDAHVTAFSAVVFEASRFGVPSVVFSPLGEALFAEELACGRAVLGLSDDGLVTALEHLLQGRALETAPAAPEDALERFVALVENAASTPARETKRRG